MSYFRKMSWSQDLSALSTTSLGPFLKRLSHTQVEDQRMQPMLTREDAITKISRRKSAEQRNGNFLEVHAPIAIFSLKYIWSALGKLKQHQQFSRALSHAIKQEKNNCISVLARRWQTYFIQEIPVLPTI